MYMYTYMCIFIYTHISKQLVARAGRPQSSADHLQEGLRSTYKYIYIVLYSHVCNTVYTTLQY